MTNRSTSWFDREELKALFKGVRPPKAPGLEGELTAPSPAPASPAEAEPAPAPAPATLDARPALPGPDASSSPGSGTEGPSRDVAAPPPISPSLPSVEPTAVEPEVAAPTEAPPPPLESGPSARSGDAPAAWPSDLAVSESADIEVPRAAREGDEPPPAPSARPPAEEAPAERRATAAETVAAPPPSHSDPTGEALWRQSEALLHLARGQATAQALEERLWEITETVASVLALFRASVWTFEDEERTRLTCADLYATGPDAHGSAPPQSARDYPLYFAALHSGRPIVAHDAKVDPRTREFKDKDVVQSRLEAPVFTAGRLAGVLRLEHDGAPRQFELHEERFATSLADLAGLALEHQERRLKEAVAKVGEERVRAQRDALAELSRSEALTRGLIEETLNEVTEAAARVLRLERASLWVYAPDFKSLFCLDAFERTAARHDRGREISEEQAPAYLDSLRAGGRLVTTDVRDDRRAAELLRDGIIPPGITSRLEAPIHLVGKLAGVLWCERAGSPRTWLADEERFAEALAGFAALSIATSERRRTENELQRVLEDLDRSGPEASDRAPAASLPEAPDAFDEELGGA